MRLFTEHGLTAPWTLYPETGELATSREWLASGTDAPGVEGIVIPGSTQPYLPRRALFKVRRRGW